MEPALFHKISTRTVSRETFYLRVLPYAMDEKLKKRKAICAGNVPSSKLCQRPASGRMNGVIPPAGPRPRASDPESLERHPFHGLIPVSQQLGHTD